MGLKWPLLKFSFGLSIFDKNGLFCKWKNVLNYFNKKTTPFTPYPARRLLLIEIFTLFPRHINDPLSIQRVSPFYYFGLSILRGERGYQHLTVARNAASTGSASSKIGAGHSKLDQFGELLAEMVGLED